jgi:hypothetical protein
MVYCPERKNKLIYTPAPLRFLAEGKGQTSVRGKSDLGLR